MSNRIRFLLKSTTCCGYGSSDVNIDLREVLSGEIVKGVADSATDIGIVAGNVHAEHLEMLPYRSRAGGQAGRRRPSSAARVKAIISNKKLATELRRPGGASAATARSAP
jgi:hypothetical protein